MVLLLGLSWWYGTGWRWAWQRVFVDRITWVSQTFSTKDMLRTLFAPFRQTYAGSVRGGIDVKFRAFIDRFVSRIIGFIIRSILLFMALVSSVVVLIVAVCLLIVWPLLPMLPIVAVGLMVSGVGV